MPMECLLSQNFLFSQALLATFFQGFGGILLLFALCFFGVQIAKIIVRGWRIYDGATESKPPEKPPEQKTENKQTPPEPIYYIVEKKRRRSKASYGDPKEIRFK